MQEIANHWRSYFKRVANAGRHGNVNADYPRVPNDVSAHGSVATVMPLPSRALARAGLPG